MGDPGLGGVIYMRRPRGIERHGDVGKYIEFMVCVRAWVQMGNTIYEFKWDDNAVRGCQRLRSAKGIGVVINGRIIVFHLE